MRHNPGTDFHRRRNDAIAADGLARRNVEKERNARAWGVLAIENIRRGNYSTARNQLAQAIAETSNSQYTGKDFDA